MNRDPGLYLDDILEAIDAIEEYTSGITAEAFSSKHARYHDWRSGSTDGSRECKLSFLCYVIGSMTE